MAEASKNQASVPFHMGNSDLQSKSGVCHHLLCLCSADTRRQDSFVMPQLKHSFLRDLPSLIKAEVGHRCGGLGQILEAEAIPACWFLHPKASKTCCPFLVFLPSTAHLPTYSSVTSVGLLRGKYNFIVTDKRLDRSIAP